MVAGDHLGRISELLSENVRKQRLRETGFGAQKEMKILVTGVKGQLGYDVVNECQKRGYDAIGVDVEEMDITNPEAVDRVIAEANPVAVFHCAARSAVEAAEESENVA